MIALLPTWGYLRHALPRIVEGPSSITAVAETMQQSDVEARRVERAERERYEDTPSRRPEPPRG